MTTVLDSLPTMRNNEPMTKPNAPRSRPYRLSDGGRAKTCQVSLSPPQAAWLASQGIPASAVLRKLVDLAMAVALPTDVG